MFSVMFVLDSRAGGGIIRRERFSMLMLRSVAVAMAIAALFGACKKSSTTPSPTLQGLTITGTTSSTT